ncbi:hypothetical protein DSECCO2_388050 [anaerobic digester metagenome]
MKARLSRCVEQLSRKVWNNVGAKAMAVLQKKMGSVLLGEGGLQGKSGLCVPAQAFFATETFRMRRFRISTSREKLMAK